MRTLLWVSWLNLLRDKVALGTVFVLPVIFFSIFAAIFVGMSGGGGGGSSAVQKLNVVALDLDESRVSQSLLGQLQRTTELELTVQRPSELSQAKTSDDIRQEVRTGKYNAGLVIPADFGRHFPDFAGQGPAIELIYDGANPMAKPMIGGVMQGSAFTAAPDLMMERGFEFLDQNAGWFLTDQQRTILQALQQQLKDATSLANNDNSDESEDTNATDGGFNALNGLVRISASEARDDTDRAQQQNQAKRKRSSMTAYYAAGIGVMFLLFSTAGAAGSILEEEESGTLERVLSAIRSSQKLLLGKWLFYALMGVVQLVIMFVFAWLVFGLDLWTVNHAVGFALMTMLTAAAASALGVMLATVCRTRAQLNGVSTVVILIMSALGGSMVPRFVMPAFMQKTSKFTFNGWALDGYLNVFWYDDPNHSLVQSVGTIVPQLAMLVAMTVAFLLVARSAAKRWEVQ